MNPLYTKKISTDIARKQYIDHEKDTFSGNIGVWIKSKTNSFNFRKWEREFEKISDNDCMFLSFSRTRFRVNFHSIVA